MSAAAPLEGPAGGDSPFVETTAGGWFFLNAVLAGPALLVLWPVAIRALLRGTGALSGPSPLLDPIPAVAVHAGPWIAWLSVVPLVTTLRNLRLPLPAPARWTLRALAALHLGVLAWWVLALVG